jgi:hypothetical protein
VGRLEEEFLIDTHGAGLEHDPEKWKPVFRKDHAGFPSVQPGGRAAGLTQAE